VLVPEDEVALIDRCRRGEAAAWDALFEEHYSATARFVFQLAAEFTPEDVEEVCQETFLSVIRNLSAFDGRSRLQTWVFRIATNKAHDFRARQNAAKRGGGHRPQSLQAEDAETGVAIDPASPAPGPDATVMRGEDATLLRVALDRLGDPCREIIELRYFGELSYEEIGNLLRLNLKTVSSRLSKCLDRLETLAREVFSGPGRETTSPFPV
jgi:RNA polymerase sigma-70 factor (ECF subfamily)